MGGKRELLFFIAVVFCVFLPTFASVPFQPQETAFVIIEVLKQVDATYAWLSPLIHISTVILIILSYKYGQKMGRITDIYFGILFLFFALSNNIAVTEKYGLVVITGNFIMFLALGIFWIWEVYRPKNEYVFQRLSVWRYWVIPFIILAFWFPMDADLSPNFNPLLLLTSSFGITFCPTTPLVIAVLTLIYPKVNMILLKFTSFVGLIIGLFNTLSLFIMPGYTLWLFILHTPLIFISLYGLVIHKIVPPIPTD